MSSPIIGLNGRPLDEEKRIVDPLGREVSTTADLTPDPEAPAPITPTAPVDAITQARIQFKNVMSSLVQKCGKKNMDRGDLASASRLLAQANHLNFEMLSMAMSDVVALIQQFEEQKFTTFMMGNQIATTLELLIDKGVFSKEELDAKWKEVAQKAQEQIRQMQMNEHSSANSDQQAGETLDSVANSCVSPTVTVNHDQDCTSVSKDDDYE